MQSPRKTVDWRQITGSCGGLPKALLIDDHDSDDNKRL